jgi:hypothetical protein
MRLYRKARRGRDKDLGGYRATGGGWGSMAPEGRVSVVCEDQVGQRHALTGTRTEAETLVVDLIRAIASVDKSQSGTNTVAPESWHPYQVAAAERILDRIKEQNAKDIRKR